MAIAGSGVSIGCVLEEIVAGLGRFQMFGGVGNIANAGTPPGISAPGVATVGTIEHRSKITYIRIVGVGVANGIQDTMIGIAGRICKIAAAGIVGGNVKFHHGCPGDAAIGGNVVAQVAGIATRIKCAAHAVHVCNGVEVVVGSKYRFLSAAIAIAITIYRSADGDNRHNIGRFVNCRFVDFVIHPNRASIGGCIGNFFSKVCRLAHHIRFDAYLLRHHSVT